MSNTGPTGPYDGKLYHFTHRPDGCALGCAFGYNRTMKYVRESRGWFLLGAFSLALASCAPEANMSQAKAFSATSATAALTPWSFTRRQPRANDVQIEMQLQEENGIQSLRLSTVYLRSSSHTQTAESTAMQLLSSMATFGDGTFSAVEPGQTVLFVSP